MSVLPCDAETDQQMQVYSRAAPGDKSVQQTHPDWKSTAARLFVPLLSS